MKRKIMIGSISAVFLLIIISFVSVVGSETNANETKESPLWGLRTRQAINQKIGIIIENINTKFLGGRLFCIPFNTQIPGKSHFFNKNIGEWEVSCILLCTGDAAFSYGCLCTEARCPTK